MKCQLKQGRAQQQPRCKGTEEPFHPTACESCSFFVCLLLATLSCDYLENSFKPLVPAANRPGRNLSRYSQNLLLPLNTEMGIATSADLEPYPQSAHVKGLLQSLICTNFGPNPQPDITGSQVPPDLQWCGQSRRGMS